MTTSTEMKADIQARIIERPMREIPNPELLPNFFNQLLSELAYMADETCRCYPSGFSPETYEGPQRDCPVHGEPAYWAASLLQDMWHHAKAGSPYGEPREYPYEHVLGPDDLDPGEG